MRLRSKNRVGFLIFFGNFTLVGFHCERIQKSPIHFTLNLQIFQIQSMEQLRIFKGAENNLSRRLYVASRKSWLWSKVNEKFA